MTAPDRPKRRISARPMTKGGVMIGSTESARSSGLAGKPRAGGDQGEGEADDRRAGAHEDREEQRVPGHAAAERAVQAVETPDRPVRELVEEDGRRERAGFVAHRAREHREDRPEDEDHHQADHETDRAGQEGVALHEAPRRPGRGTGARGTRGRGGTPPCRSPPGWGRAIRASRSSHAADQPSMADGQPLEGGPREAPATAQHEDGRDARILLAGAATRGTAGGAGSRIGSSHGRP